MRWRLWACVFSIIPSLSLLLQRFQMLECILETNTNKLKLISLKLIIIFSSSQIQKEYIHFVLQSSLINTSSFALHFYNITFQMSQLQIETQGLPNELAFKIHYPDVPNITFNFRLNINVSKQSLTGELAQVYTKNIYVVQKQIRIKPLEGNCIYKLQVDLNINNRIFKKNAFTFIPLQAQNQQNQQNNDQISQQYEIPSLNQTASNVRESSMKFRGQKTKFKRQPADPFSRSEDFMRMVGRSVGINDSKKLDKYILEGRKCRNTAQFLNSNKDFQASNIKKTIQKHKMLLKGKIIFRDVYKQSAGQAFFKNDWFMGPFYSYDHNEKKLLKE